MTMNYTLRCFNGTGGMIRMIMRNCVDERAAFRMAAQECADCERVELHREDHLVWSGSPHEAASAAA